jgi:hypothetical protein
MFEEEANLSFSFPFFTVVVADFEEETKHAKLTNVNLDDSIIWRN